MTGPWIPYCGPGSTPGDWLSRWNPDPALLAGLAAGLALMLMLTRGDRTGRAWAMAGLGVLALVFVSPLCALSSALFSARAVHHVLIVAVAAPLLARALPRASARGLGPAILVHGVIFWVWHAPSAYGLALSHDGAYWLMQATLLGSAIWFWSALRRADDPVAVAGLLIAMVQMGLLGALITFAGRPLYEPHLLSVAPWGLSPLEDQQAAGLIMWVPAAALYLAAALARLWRVIGPDPDARAAP